MKADTLLRLLALSAMAVYLIKFYPAYFPFPQLTGILTSFVLNAAGIPSVLDGNLLFVPFPGLARVLELSAECSGIAIFSIFVFAIFSLPDLPLRHRMLALPFIPLLFLGNVARILVGIFLGYYVSSDFIILFHNTAGQVLVFMWAIVVYVVWLKTIGNFPTENAAYEADLNL